MIDKSKYRIKENLTNRGSIIFCPQIKIFGLFWVSPFTNDGTSHCEHYYTLEEAKRVFLEYIKEKEKCKSFVVKYHYLDDE